MIRGATQRLDQGYALLEAACKNANAAVLPGILRAAQGHLQKGGPSVKPEVHVKVEEGEDAGEGAQQLDRALEPIKVEPGCSYEPITVKIPGGGYQYKCPLCPADIITKSKNGMRAHIREIHTGEVLLCEMCDFSTYNPDSLSKHARQLH